MVNMNLNHEVNCTEIDMKFDDGVSPTLREQYTVVS